MMIRLALFLGLLMGMISVASGQLRSIPKGVNVPCPVCKASDKAEKSFVPPPVEFLLKSSEPKCDIIVTYDGFPDSVKVAFEHAVGIWESIIESEVPIRLFVEWASLDPNVLASCGPETYYAGFENAPFPHYYYPVAIAEKLAKQELNGTGRFEIKARFSSEIDWYFGIDGDTPIGAFDFVTVVLHEIGHGLGFTGFFFVDGNLGGYGYDEMGDFTSFDALVESISGEQLVDTDFFNNASTGLKNTLVSGTLYSNSPVARSSETGVRPRLYAPDEFDGGSSVYHLNDATYRTGTANALMTHAIAPGEANHDPGPLARGIMEDIGWTNLILRHWPVKDKEQVAPLDFRITVDSYYNVPEDASFVVYSTDGFSSQQDTLPLIPTGNANEYGASLAVAEGTESLQYYVVTSDEKGRVRTSPWNAPKAVHNVAFGPDTEAPVITHAPIEYFLNIGEPLAIQANVDDNLGLDTVFVNYSVNGVQQTSFGLTLAEGTDYTGVFGFNPETLNDGDVIAYEIVAKDASVAQNETVYPPEGRLEFSVEQVFAPVAYSENNFNTKNADFLLTDFDIYTALNFSNGALHSPHPYPSPNEDNKEYNFVTLLKHPIILKEDGAMWFDEVVLVEPGTGSYGGDSFWDYVIVEGSKDFGKTWAELADGYDAGANQTWLTEYGKSFVNQVSQAVGAKEWFVNHEISLLENGNFQAGDTILVRFRLYSDPYASGWGWTIDNLRIQQPVSVPVTVLSPGQVNVYPNPFLDKFKIEIYPDQPLKNVQLDVFDSFGRKIYSTFTKSLWGQYSATVDLHDQASGMFLLRVSENGKPVLSKKLIKN